MALQDLAWYLSHGDGSTTGYYAVTKWAVNTAKNCGDIVRQNTAPALGNERCFVCIVGGTTNATTEPAWVITRGGKSPVDGTVTWQEATGIPALNGDRTNNVNWTAVKNTAVSLGQVILSGDGTKILICSTAGTAGNAAEPTWAAYTTAGATTVDNTATWTTLKDLSNNFSNWAAPFAVLIPLYSAGSYFVAGNTIFAADNSADINSAGTVYTVPTAAGLTSRLVSIDHTLSLPVTGTKAGASITISGLNDLNMNPSATVGCMYVDGFTFTLDPSLGNMRFNNIAGGKAYLRNSGIVFRAGGGTINACNTGSGSTTTWDNVYVSYTNASQVLNASGNFYWKNTANAVRGTAVPTILITVGTALPAMVLLEGLDISAVNTTILGYTNAALGSGPLMVKDCKINVSATLSAAITSPGGTRAQLLRSDSGNTNYKIAVSDYPGTITTETTIVRTGGASDGTTAVSWKFVTTANSLYFAPLTAPDIRIWNDTVGTVVTCTVFGIWGGGAVPFNDDIYFDLEYMGTASLPQGNFVDCGLATPLTTHAGQLTDASTWGGSTTPFKMQVTFTAQQKGYVTIRVRAVKPSTTFYIDPKPVLT